MAAHLFNESGQMQEVDIPDIFDVLEGGEDENAVKFLLGFSAEESAVITDHAVRAADPGDGNEPSAILLTKEGKPRKRDPVDPSRCIFHCDNCGKAFTTKFNLKRHINLHCSPSKEAGVPPQGPPSASMPSRKARERREALAALGLPYESTKGRPPSKNKKSGKKGKGKKVQVQQVSSDSLDLSSRQKDTSAQSKHNGVPVVKASPGEAAAVIIHGPPEKSYQLVKTVQQTKQSAYQPHVVYTPPNSLPLPQQQLVTTTLPESYPITHQGMVQGIPVNVSFVPSASKVIFKEGVIHLPQQPLPNVQAIQSALQLRPMTSVTSAGQQVTIARDLLIRLDSRYVGMYVGVRRDISIN
jgi:hypothetical protein